MSFLKTIVQNAQALPAKTALEFVDSPLQRVTYSELDQGVQQTQRYLSGLGVQPGVRVAFQLPKCVEFIYLHLATLHLGAISLPLNPAYPGDELQYFLDDSGASVFFSTIADRPVVEPLRAKIPGLKQCVYLDLDDPRHFWALVDRHADAQVPRWIDKILPDDTAIMIYTSGTTGRPKGAEITHANLTANLGALHTAWGWESEDILLHALPLFHVHGLIVALHGALNAGASALLVRTFDPTRILSVLAERRCTVFMGVPTIYKRLLAVPEPGRYDLSQMRLFTSGSDRLPEDTFLNFRGAFGHTLLERYGMTETGMNLSNPLVGERRMGSVGLPLPGVEARIVDPKTDTPIEDGKVGEVQIRGPHVFKSYWRQPEKTAAAFTADGWLRTGDLGVRQPDGYYELKGRAKDLIITGGLNVYPPEVERVLSGHPAVAACAVIGCPDPEWGERVVALVVLKPSKNVPPQELIEYCRERLAAYKCPKAVLFLEDLPRNAMGKVQKPELRELYCRREHSSQD